LDSFNFEVSVEALRAIKAAVWLCAK
jgi:hypothetical protein